jgi:predicted transcriptional regulator
MGSNFIKRLKYYGIGFGIGIIIITFLLPNRSCSWTPANRVKNMVLGRVVTVNEVEWQLMQKKGITKEDILSVLNDGSVDFKNSKKDGDSKVYAIDKTLGNKGEYRFYFTLPNESFISEVKIGEVNAKKVKNTTEGYGHFISVPKDEYLIYPDSTAKVSCQMQTLTVKNVKQLYKDIEKTGRINFSKTNFEAKPKAEHVIEYVQSGDTIEFQSVWYKNKIFISNFISDRVTNCNPVNQE